MKESTLDNLIIFMLMLAMFMLSVVYFPRFLWWLYA